MAEYMECKFCGTSLKKGVFACIGCHASIQYGPTQGQLDGYKGGMILLFWGALIIIPGLLGAMFDDVGRVVVSNYFMPLFNWLSRLPTPLGITVVMACLIILPWFIGRHFQKKRERELVGQISFTRKV